MMWEMLVGADGALLQNVGCDYEIDSHAVEDRCGVCHGDGSTCHTIHKTFEDSEGLGKGTSCCAQNTACLVQHSWAAAAAAPLEGGFNYNLSIFWG